MSKPRRPDIHSRDTLGRCDCGTEAEVESQKHEYADPAPNGAKRGDDNTGTDLGGGF